MRLPLQGAGRAGAGFAPVATVDAPGGILVHGEIVHSASALVHLLRGYRTADASEALPRYLLGLALAGLVHAMREGLGAAIAYRHRDRGNGCSGSPSRSLDSGWT